MAKKQGPDAQLLTVRERAVYLHLDEVTVNKLVASGKIPALQLERRDIESRMGLGRQDGHGEPVVARRRLPILFERLHERRDEDHPVPLQLIAHGENRIEVAAMKRIERAAADTDVHVGGEAANASSSRAEFSRTIRASIRTSSRTPSPTTAEML